MGDVILVFLYFKWSSTSVWQNMCAVNLTAYILKALNIEPEHHVGTKK